MKKLFDVAVLVLAVNLIAVLGAVGWLFQSKKLTKEKVHQIKELVFPKQEAPEVVATQPSEPTTRPSSIKLEELLARYAGRRTTGEQVQLIQQSIDAQVAALDRRSQELDGLMQQILREKEELARKTKAVEAERTSLSDQQKQVAAKAADKGFADSLKLYNTIPTKQAKTIFMGLPDELVARYLRAMSPRTAAGILEEFKTPDEQAYVARVMEQVRRGDSPTTRPSTDAAANATPAGSGTAGTSSRPPGAPSEGKRPPGPPSAANMAAETARP